MRGMGLFFGVVKRNQPVQLADPRPLINYGDDVCTGDAGRDGFTVLSRADPTYAGTPPLVAGALGQARQGPDNSWEQ